MIVLYILVGIVVVALLAGIAIYNKLVRLRNTVVLMVGYRCSV